MAELAMKVLVVCFFTWIGWSILQPRYVFVIHIKGGQPCVQRGKVTRVFLGLLTEACRDGGVTEGWVGGVQQGQRTALRFSRQVPAGLQQRLRNQWHMTS
jgi:hypothetical protein